MPVLTAIIRDRTGHYLLPRDLWRALRDAGYEPNPWRTTAGLAVCVDEANRSFRSSRESTLIAGDLIDRPEADRLRELVGAQRVVLVDGDAGAGKSDVLLQFIRGLEQESIPHLALRLDRIAPTLLPKSVGTELGLPGSPVATLSAHAQRAMCVLVIDQLDIVSTTSGRIPQLFDCVTEMVNAAATVPMMRVVLCCRTFDLENDSRLRRLISAQGRQSVLTVGALAHEQVIGAVAAFGFEPGRLSDAQIEILSKPLHLALLGEIAASLLQESSALGFVRASDLFGAFWDFKRREVEHRLGRAPSWTQVLDALSDFMSDSQLLRAPSDVADRWESDLQAMVSSNVLVKDGDHIAFFHEAFFDYVFCRRFAGRGRTLATLLEIDQDLFRRAQVRQILAYKRDRGLADHYIRDLRYMLHSGGIRFHLRDLVVSWLQRISPSPSEWDELRPHLDDPQSPLHNAVWRTVATPNWFPMADQSHYIDDCLRNSDPTRIGLILPVLGCGSGRYLDRALELLRPYLDESPSWTAYLASLLQQVDVAEGRPAFDLLIELLKRGAIDDSTITARDFWYRAAELPVKNPMWANELLGHYLENRIAAAASAGLATST